MSAAVLKITSSDHKFHNKNIRMTFWYHYSNIFNTKRNGSLIIIELSDKPQWADKNGIVPEIDINAILNRKMYDIK